MFIKKRGDIMTQEERFLFDKSPEMYLIILINKIYYLLDGLENREKEEFYQKLQKIIEDFSIHQSIFTDIEYDLETNAPFKQYKYMAMLEYEEQLEKLATELKSKSKPKKELFSLVLAKIILYAKLLLQRKTDLEEWKYLTAFLASIIYNLTEDTIVEIEKEIAYLFLENLKIVGVKEIPMVIEHTHPFFYPKIISMLEYYLVKTILKKEENPIWIECLKYKGEHTTKEYLGYLLEIACSYKILYKESLFLKV